MMLRRALKRLAANGADIAALLCAGTMLVAVLTTAPWTTPDDLAGNAGATVPTAAAGVAGQAGAETGSAQSPTMPGVRPLGRAASTEGDAASGEATADNEPTQTQALLIGVLPDNLAQFAPCLVAVGALIAAGGALWNLIRRDERSRRVAPVIVAAGGVIAMLYFVYFFGVFFAGQGSAPLTDVVQLVPSAFWIALAGVGGLFVLSAAPRRPLAEVSPPAQGVEDAAQSADARPAAPAGIQSAGVAGINVFQNLWVAFDALLANKLRSFLTMLGVIIGVAAVVSLISVGQSAGASITDRIEGAGANTISVSSRGRSAQYVLTYEDVEAMETRLTHVIAAAPRNSLQATVEYGSASVNISVIATTAPYAEVNVLTMRQGRFLNAADEEGKARVAVLGSQAAEDLFDDANPIGQDIRINDIKFEVVGVVEPTGTGGGFGDPDSVVYVPLSTASRRLSASRTIIGGKVTISTIQLLADSSDTVTQVIDQVEALLRERFDVALDENLPFSVFSASVLLETVASVYTTLTIFLGAIAGISLLVGGIGIMNITLVSVTERTKEIGLRKAVGAQRLHILAQFLIETVVLSTSGGILGILVSGGIMLLVNASGVMTASLSVAAVALGFGFSVLVGVFFGLYPANRAARLQPIEALRYE